MLLCRIKELAEDAVEPDAAWQWLCNMTPCVGVNPKEERMASQQVWLMVAITRQQQGSRPPQRLMKKETISFEQDFRSMSVFQQLASSPEFWSIAAMLYPCITPRFLVAIAFSKTKARANKIITFFKVIVSMLICACEIERKRDEGKL